MYKLQISFCVAGPITWVKFPKYPTIGQIAKAWNCLVDNDLMGSVEYNKGCAA